jgi:hypothetical protein
MILKRLVSVFVVGCFLISLTSIQSVAFSALEKSKVQKTNQEQNEQNGGDVNAILWEEPTDIESRDLFYGIGGQEGAPDPSGQFVYIRRPTSGTQKKIIVKDDKGREWTVKFGAEAKPETFASRLVWAAGYHVDQNYFVKSVKIKGMKEPEVTDVRFELNDDRFKTVGNWSWDKHPFRGTRELDGLKVLIALLKNWDVKTDNNKIVTLVQKGEDKTKHIYYISDLGATLGLTGSYLNKVPLLSDLPPNKTIGPKKGKGNPKAFAKEEFIEEIKDGEVIFHFNRKRGQKILEGVKVENARWMGSILGRLSDKQLTDALRASGFDDYEISIYLRTLQARIIQLQNLED